MDKPKTTKNIREYLKDSYVESVQYPEAMLTEYKFLILHLCNKLDEIRKENNRITKAHKILLDQTIGRY